MIGVPVNFDWLAWLVPHANMFGDRSRENLFGIIFEDFTGVGRQGEYDGIAVE